MDLIKIGKYIAGKRKELGLTQRQIAEQLGMSDKSVSKWERGVCLPDVSVYMELCNLLGISINEFLAGEDIDEENIVKKSEDNLIQVAKDSKEKQKVLKRIIIAFSIAAMLLLGFSLYRVFGQPQNYVVPFDKDSTEMKTTELLSGVDGAFLFKYSAKGKFKKLYIYISEYQSGKLITKSKAAELTYEDIDSATEGMIAIVPDFEEGTMKLIITDDYAKYSTDIQILENEKNREYLGRTSSQIEEITPIRYNQEQGLAAFMCSEQEMDGLSVDTIESGEFETKNDYIYYVSFEFEA